MGSGEFPLCFDAIGDEEKKAIMKNNLNAELSLANKRIATIQPKYYLPYGSFAEAKSGRDQFIKQKMTLHSPQSYEDICNKNGVHLCSVIDNRIYDFGRVFGT